MQALRLLPPSRARRAQVMKVRAALDGVVAHCVTYHTIYVGTLYKHEGAYRLDNGQLIADCGQCEYCRANNAQLHNVELRRYAQRLFRVALPPLARVRSTHGMIETHYEFSIDDHPLFVLSCAQLGTVWIEDDVLLDQGRRVLRATDVLLLCAESLSTHADQTLDPRVPLQRALIAALVAQLRRTRPSRPPIEHPFFLARASLKPLKRLLA